MVDGGHKSGLLHGFRSTGSVTKSDGPNPASVNKEERFSVPFYRGGDENPRSYRKLIRIKYIDRIKLRSSNGVADAYLGLNGSADRVRATDPTSIL
jgi:hypothetical protein